MRLSLEVSARDGDVVTLRLAVFNDSASPVELDRRLLVGPNGVVEAAEPWPVSLEPPAREPRMNVVLLNASCFYGRERQFTVREPTTFHAYLVAKPGGGLLPDGPADGKLLVA